MGLLDWFRRRRRPPISIWLDAESHLRGFVAAIIADLGQRETVLVVGHFKEALVLAGRELAAAGIEFEVRSRWTPQDSEHLRMGHTEVIMILAGALPNVPDHAARISPEVGLPTVSVRVVDLHVLNHENERVELFASSLPVPARVQMSLSLDDPIMTAFAKPWVKTMMSRLGLKADKPIEGAMIDNGVRRALQKLAKTATGNEPCDSIQEWLRRNRPE